MLFILLICGLIPGIFCQECFIQDYIPTNNSITVDYDNQQHLFLTNDTDLIFQTIVFINDLENGCINCAFFDTLTPDLNPEFVCLSYQSDSQESDGVNPTYIVLGILGALLICIGCICWCYTLSKDSNRSGGNTVVLCV